MAPDRAKVGDVAAGSGVATLVAGQGRPGIDDDWDVDRPTWMHPIRRYEWSGRRFLPGLSFPIVVWAVWRVIQYVITFRQVGPVKNPWLSTFDVAFNYDGERYLLIMQQGYANANVEMPNQAFFPMVSWIASPFWWLTRSEGWTIHLVASITAIAAFCAVWGITREWRNEVIARRAVLLMAMMPSSLFLWAFYSEALFISLGAGAVLADRKNKHWLAAALFVPLAATRSVGILVPLVVVLARIIRHRKIDKWCLVYVAAGALGLGIVMTVMWAQIGNAVAFIWRRGPNGQLISVQEDWGRGLSAPWTTVKQGIDNLYPKPDTIMIPALVARNFDLWSLLIVGVPLFAAMGMSWRSKTDGWPMETWMIGWALVALPLCSTALASFNRFALATWVIYPISASLLGRIPSKVRWIPYCVLAGAGFWVSWLMVGRYAADRFVG